MISCFQYHTEFQDFTTAHVIIRPPNVIEPESAFYVTIYDDDLLEPDEVLVVSLVHSDLLTLPAPYASERLPSPPGSTVLPPPDENIVFDLPSTKIIIRGGIMLISEGMKDTCNYCLSSLAFTAETQLFVNFTVPEVVQEGDSFFPVLTLSQPAVASFRVYSLFDQGTATKNLDYSFTNQNINFGLSDFALSTSSPVKIYADSVVEPDETFNLSFYLTESSSTYHFVTIGDSVKTITIADRNSESACVLNLLSDIIYYNFSLYNFFCILSVVS